LLFEALGEVSDRNALIVNLNVFDKEYPPALEERAYIVFNPYSSEKALTFTPKYLSEPYELYAGASKLGAFEPGDSFTITLPARGSAYIRSSE